MKIIKHYLVIFVLLWVNLAIADSSVVNSSKPNLIPTEIYGAKDAPIKIRIANGGAGPTGIFRALAEDYLKLTKQHFAIAWYRNISANSLKLLHAKQVDVAIIYEPASTLHAVENGWGSHLSLIFNDHFLITGPKNNPANIEHTDTPASAFSKIAKTGASSSMYSDKGLFLSRNDSSGTNTKEQHIWQLSNLMPWNQRAGWYVKSSVFPKEALLQADKNSLYTITDRGTWLTNRKALKNTVIYLQGSDMLKNPAFGMLSQNPSPMAIDFLNYLRSPRAQHLIANYGKNSNLGAALFTPAYSASMSSSR